MPKNTMSFADQPPASGKDVKDTKMLDTTSRDVNATGKNVLERKTGKHKPFGKLGVKGMP